MTWIRKLALLSPFLLVSAAALAEGPLSVEQEAVEALKKEIRDDDIIAAPALRKFAEEHLVPYSVDSSFVRAVKKQNAKKVPLEKIQLQDKEWIATGSTTTFKTTLIANHVSKELQKIARELPAVQEAFVMDNQGAVVGETNLTSDYWQGDEKKWTESF